MWVVWPNLIRVIRPTYKVKGRYDLTLFKNIQLFNLFVSSLVRNGADSAIEGILRILRLCLLSRGTKEGVVQVFFM